MLKKCGTIPNPYAITRSVRLLEPSVLSESAATRGAEQPGLKALKRELHHRET